MNVFELIRSHEGERRLVYDDADGMTLAPGALLKGNPTVGVGRNLIGKGLSADEIDYLLHNDIAAARRFLGGYVWFGGLDEIRQAALMDLVFNEGEQGFAGFAKMIGALATENYSVAAAELLDSKGARELPGRYAQLADMLRSGRWPQGAKP